MLIADSPLIHLKTASCMSKRKMKKNCEEGNFYTKICCLLKRQAKHNASVGQINTKVKPEPREGFSAVSRFIIDELTSEVLNWTSADSGFETKE